MRLKNLVYWLLLIVILLGIFQFFFTGRVNLGFTAVCFNAYPISISRCR